MVADADELGKPTRYRWYVLALIFVMYTLAFADRANIGMALPYIKQEFALDNAGAGLIAGLFSVIYAICQIPAGFIVRRFGVRRTVPVAMALTSLVAASGGLAQSATFLRISRAALGIVEAPIGLALMCAINNWFPRREKGTAAGIFSAATKFGPVIVPPLGAVIIASYGWRPVFWIFALPGLVAAGAWYLFIGETPQQCKWVNAAEVIHIADLAAANEEVESGARPQLRVSRTFDRIIRARVFEPMDTPGQVLRSATLWGVATCYLLVQSVVSVILFLLPLYLKDEKHLSVMNVGWVAAAPFAGAVVGNVAGGIISDRLFSGRRKPMMMLTFAATAGMMWTLTFAPDQLASLASLLFVTGVVLAVGYSPYAIYAAPMTGKRTFPLTVSVINTMGQIGTALAPLVTGIVLDRHGWRPVFLGLSVSSLLGLAILMLIAEPIDRTCAKA